MNEYHDRVAERRNWELREISRAIYGAAAAMSVIIVGMGILLVYSVGAAR